MVDSFDLHTIGDVGSSSESDEEDEDQQAVPTVRCALKTINAQMLDFRAQYERQLDSLRALAESQAKEIETAKQDAEQLRQENRRLEIQVRELDEDRCKQARIAAKLALENRLLRDNTELPQTPPPPPPEHSPPPAPPSASRDSAHAANAHRACSRRSCPQSLPAEIIAQHNQSVAEAWAHRRQRQLQNAKRKEPLAAGNNDSHEAHRCRSRAKAERANSSKVDRLVAGLPVEPRRQEHVAYGERPQTAPATGRALQDRTNLSALAQARDAQQRVLLSLDEAEAVAAKWGAIVRRDAQGARVQETDAGVLGRSPWKREPIRLMNCSRTVFPTATEEDGAARAPPPIARTP